MKRIPYGLEVKTENKQHLLDVRHIIGHHQTADIDNYIV